MSSMKDTIYYKDSYLKSLKTKVVSCSSFKDKYIIVLEKTCFYPEGGGQPADTGFIGTARVVDVHQKNGVIEHTTSSPLDEGEEVEITIDWGKRLRNMQHHSAEHIVSGLVHKHFGLNNVGFHMGESFVTMDFDGVISYEDLMKIQNEANEIVRMDIETKQSYPTKEELETLNYRSKKPIDGEVRIVNVAGADVCACCGTHVARSGEIGLIRIMGAQKNKGGTRVNMICAKRAELDYTKKDEMCEKLANMFSTKPENIINNVEKLVEELSLQKQIISELRGESFKHKAGQIVDNGKCVFLHEQGLSSDELRVLATMVAKKISTLCCVVCGDDENGYKYAIASQNIDLKQKVKDINTALSGRGGGSKELIQGSFSASKNEAEKFFDGLYS